MLSIRSPLPSRWKAASCGASPPPCLARSPLRTGASSNRTSTTIRWYVLPRRRKSKALSCRAADSGAALASRRQPSWVPAHDDAVPGLLANVVIGCQPFALDNVSAGRNRALLVLRRKRDRPHLALKLGQHMGRLVLGVQKLALLPIIGAAVAEEIGFVSLRDRRQVQYLEATLLLQIACQIVLMHPLHDQDDARRLLVVGARQQGRAVPFDDPRPYRFRHGIAKL